MAMSKNEKYGLGAVALIFVAILFFTGGNLSKLGQPASITASTTANSLSVNTASITPTSQPITNSNGLPPGSVITVNSNPSDELAGTSLTEGTNTVSTWLQKSGNGYTFFVSGTSKSYTIQDPNGYVYVALAAASGQTYALDINTFKQNNANFYVGSTYMDWDGDGGKEWVLTLNTKGTPTQQQNFGQIPTYTITQPWLNVDAAVTLTAPTAQSSIGTSAIDEHNLVKVVGTQKKAQFYKEIDVDFNSTSTSKWDTGLTYIQLPFGTYTLNQAASTSVSSTDTIYYFKFGNDQSQVPVVTIPNNGNTARYDDLKVRWTLSTGDKINTKTTYFTYSATDSAQASSAVTFLTTA